MVDNAGVGGCGGVVVDVGYCFGTIVVAAQTTPIVYCGSQTIPMGQRYVHVVLLVVFLLSLLLLL